MLNRIKYWFTNLNLHSQHLIRIPNTSDDISKFKQFETRARQGNLQVGKHMSYLCGSREWIIKTAWIICSYMRRYIWMDGMDGWMRTRYSTKHCRENWRKSAHKSEWYPPKKNIGAGDDNWWWRSTRLKLSPFLYWFCAFKLWIWIRVGNHKDFSLH